MSDAVRSFSFGGGVQSTAVLALQATGQLQEPFDVFLMANVGDDSEHPATLEYVREIAVPFAEAHGIELRELERVKRDGSTETLLQRLTKPGSRSLPIPVRMPDTGAPGTRNCTHDFKIRVVLKELKRLGATKDNPATVGLGISTDEIQRAKPGLDPKNPEQFRVYPLLDLGMDRNDCHNAIRDAGLPIPPKSACWFCPFHTAETWRRMARTEPDLFQRAVDLERLLIERREMLGRDPVYFTRFGRPLDEVVDGNQMAMFDGPDEGCESGYCFT